MSAKQVLPSYSTGRKEGAIAKKGNVYIKETGYHPDRVVFGWNLDNTLGTSANMPWFKGWKVTYKDGNAVETKPLEVLNCIPSPIGPTNKPLQLPLQDVHKIDSSSTVPVGQVEEMGVFKLGIMVTSVLANVTTQAGKIC